MGRNNRPATYIILGAFALSIFFPLCQIAPGWIGCAPQVIRATTNGEGENNSETRRDPAPQLVRQRTQKYQRSSARSDSKRNFLASRFFRKMVKDAPTLLPWYLRSRETLDVPPLLALLEDSPQAPRYPPFPA